MTTREGFRAAVVAAVETLKTSWVDYTLLVEYDNRIVVDTQTQVNPFLCVHIVYTGGEQASLGQTQTHHRVYGSVIVSAAVKLGSGTKQANDLLEHFIPSLHLTSIGGARMWGASPEKDKEHRGWIYYPVVIPFDFDELN